MNFEEFHTWLSGFMEAVDASGQPMTKEQAMRVHAKVCKFQEEYAAHVESKKHMAELADELYSSAHSVNLVTNAKPQ